MLLTEAELRAWGLRIGRQVEAPVFIGLRGPLGAGKSVLARAVARGAGVQEHLPSPTFNLVFRYPVPERALPAVIVHADLFRLRSSDELGGIGWDDLVTDEGAIVLVEWPDRAGPELPADRWVVTLGHADADAGLRTVEVERHGEPPALPGFPVVVE